YGGDQKDHTRLILDVDLPALSKAGHVAVDGTHDVAVVRIGTAIDVQGKRHVSFDTNLTVKSLATSGFVSVGLEGIKRFDEVLVANNVLIFGYPTSIGLKQLPQIDYARPLLRVGIVAGKNEANRTL